MERSKYGNKKTVVNEVKIDSKKEAKHNDDLLI